MPAGVTDTIKEWESTGFPNEKIKPPIVANNSFSPKLRYINNLKINVESKGSFLK